MSGQLEKDIAEEAIRKYLISQSSRLESDYGDITYKCTLRLSKSGDGKIIRAYDESLEIVNRHRDVQK